ncbi:MAG: FKBP-type peptidyl-prolyl cis-trans isomerase [Candidatus Hatepunaea meridiana]|nr:FKBP-type peptidyl-prolyl cis-trans isomerase [Candidatus Hatepunaea meridiana]
MKKLGLVILLAALMGCQQNGGRQSIELQSKMDKVSYGIGFDIGDGLHQQEFELVPEIVARGLEDAMKAEEPLMTKEEMEETLKKFQEEIMTKQNAGKNEMGEVNIKEGDEFLTANKAKEGVITTESGLQYKVIKAGTGRTPKRGDTVETHYRGTLINGKEFDSSYKRNQTATFPVSGVIKGWTEALMLMKEGAKWQLFIPSDLAYGPRGAGGDIGPNATLIFDIELIAVK